MKRDARDSPMAGFYIPPQVSTQNEFKTAASMFVSPDGRAVRYMRADRPQSFRHRGDGPVRGHPRRRPHAQPNTTLADASISAAGCPRSDDVRTNYNHDLIFIITMTIVVVFADPRAAAAGGRGAAVSHWFSDDFVSVGARDRRRILPIDPRRAHRMEMSPGRRSLSLSPSGPITTCCSSRGFAMRHPSACGPVLSEPSAPRVA